MNLLRALRPDALAAVQYALVESMLRAKMLRRGKFLGRVMVAFDGTLRERKRGRGLAGKRKRRMTLEARITAPWGWNVTLASEPLEPWDDEREKQDHELAAFARLAPRLKRRFPRLPVCVLGDALYDCAAVVGLCRQCSWSYILTSKGGWRRWLVENGSHEQKGKDGFGLEHSFCTDETAGRNMHALMTIAYTLWQLLHDGYLKRLGARCRHCAQICWADVLRDALRLGGIAFGELDGRERARWEDQFPCRITYAQFAATAATAKTQDNGRRRNEAATDFVRSKPKAAKDRAATGSTATIRNAARGLNANAPGMSPDRRANAARVDPQDAHGTPIRRLSGQTVVPVRYAAAANTPTATTATRKARAAPRDSLPWDAAPRLEALSAF